MGFSAKKFNRAKIFDVDTTDFDYYNLEEYFKSIGGDYDFETEIKGVYINTMGLYDDSPVLAIEDRYINLPSHLTETCRQMLADPQAIAAIKAGKLGFKVQTYFKKKFNKECYTVEFVDI